MKTIQKEPLSSRHKRPSCVKLLKRFAEVEVFGDDEPHLVDLDMAEEVARYRWRANWQGYAYANIGGHKMRLHRFVFRPTIGGLEIDHISQDRRDNRRSNLRMVMHGLNIHNSAARGKSKFKGVCWIEKVQKWKAQICVNYCNRSLGRFTDEAEAARAYDRAAIEHYGVDADINFSCR